MPYSRTGARAGETENGRNTQDRVRVGADFVPGGYRHFFFHLGCRLRLRNERGV